MSGKVGKTRLRRGDHIAIDGTVGAITIDEVPLVEPEMGEDFRTILAWADELGAERVLYGSDAGGRSSIVFSKV